MQGYVLQKLYVQNCVDDGVDFNQIVVGSLGSNEKESGSEDDEEEIFELA